MLLKFESALLTEKPPRSRSSGLSGSEVNLRAPWDDCQQKFYFALSGSGLSGSTYEAGASFSGVVVYG